MHLIRFFLCYLRLYRKPARADNGQRSHSPSLRRSNDQDGTLSVRFSGTDHRHWPVGDHLAGLNAYPAKNIGYSDNTNKPAITPLNTRTQRGSRNKLRSPVPQPNQTHTLGRLTTANTNAITSTLVT